MSGTIDSEAADREAMARLARGDERALDELMERHAGRVFQFFWRRLDQEEDAKDLAQETFVRLYQAAGRYDGSRSFTTWLYTIAANLARNRIRWRQRHPEAELPADSTELGRAAAGERSTSRTPREQLLREERAAAVRAAVERLPERLREVVILCEWEELSVPQAAAVLRRTPKAVESLLYRARRRLREELADWLC